MQIMVQSYTNNVHFSEYFYGGAVGGITGEPLFSYKVLPVDSYTSPAIGNFASSSFDQDLHSGYNPSQVCAFKLLQYFKCSNCLVLCSASRDHFCSKLHSI